MHATTDARESAWTEWFIAQVERAGWARQAGLRGRAAVTGFYQAWESLAEDLFAVHIGPKLRIVDPHDDWDAALARIFEAVRPTSAG